MENLPVENEPQSNGEGRDRVSSGQAQAEVHGRRERSAHPAGRDDDEHVDEKCQGAEEDQDGRPGLVDFRDVLGGGIDFLVHGDDSALIGQHVTVTVADAVTCVEPQARHSLAISTL